MNIFFDKPELSYFGALSCKKLDRQFYQCFRDRGAGCDTDAFNSVEPARIDTVMIIHKMRLCAL